MAKELAWMAPWSKVLEWDPPFAKWIVGGFSARAIRDRAEDAESRVIVTADGGYRRGAVLPLKKIVDEAIADLDVVRHVVVFKRAGVEVSMREGRDHWWHELMVKADAECEPEAMDATDPLFILYTSGTTGKPKGIEHSTGGYLVGVATTTKYVFDLKDEDLFWCTADIGWVTGHSYIVYGPLANGASVFMYEGAPDWPEPDRLWRMVEEYDITILYTAPTAIRAFMRWGDEYPKRHDLASLRLVGTVGEPINPEAWRWYRKTIGGGRCPIVDTWWQTETGMILITPLPGVTTTKPGSATRPFPGIDAEVVDEKGLPVPMNKGGYLVIRKPWPSMLQTLYKDPERYKQVYWSQVPGKYFTGDGARMDEDQFFWLMGRIDDVINVAGHRIGRMEVESALVSHGKVAEAAVVGKPHPVKGQSLVAYVVLKRGESRSDGLKKDRQKHGRQPIGPTAVPDDVRITDERPEQHRGRQHTFEEEGRKDEDQAEGGSRARVGIRLRIDHKEGGQEGEADGRHDHIDVFERLERVDAGTRSRPSRARNEGENDSDRESDRDHGCGPQRRAHSPFPLTWLHDDHLWFSCPSRCSRRRSNGIPWRERGSTPARTDLRQS